MPTDKPRISVILEDDVLKAVEAHRYFNGFRSLSKAVMDLIQKGLARETPPVPSNAIFKGDELRLIALFRKSTDDDREHIMNVALKAHSKRVAPKVRYLHADDDDDGDRSLDITALNCFASIYPYLPESRQNYILEQLITGYEGLLEPSLLKELQSTNSNAENLAAERAEPLGSEDDVSGN